MDKTETEDRCPWCDVDLTYEVDGRTYSRKVGYEISHIYDGILFWYHEECGRAWHRWSKGHVRRIQASTFFDEATGYFWTKES